MGGPRKEPGQWVWGGDPLRGRNRVVSREETPKGTRTGGLSDKGTLRALGTAGVMGYPERGWNSGCDPGPRV